MTAPGEPTRWRDDPSGAPSGAAGVLRSYGAQRATQDERRALQERLAPWLEASETPLPLRLGAWRVTVRTGLVLGVAALTWWIAQHRLHPDSAARAPASQMAVQGAPRLEQDVTPSVAVPVRETSTLLAAPSIEIAKPAVRVRKRSAVPTPLTAASVHTSPERELELLRKAQQALRRSPRTSEALLAEHAQAYPHGVFEQEREMLRIELAVVSGQHGRARTLAQQFLTRFGRSTYQHRIETLLTAKIAQEDPPAVDTQSMDATTH